MKMDDFFQGKIIIIIIKGQLQLHRYQLLRNDQIFCISKISQDNY